MQKENVKVVNKNKVILNRGPYRLAAPRKVVVRGPVIVFQDLQRTPLCNDNNKRGRFRIKYGMTSLFNNGNGKIGRCRIKCGKTPNFKGVGPGLRPSGAPLRSGFTLIELLVVVLIIGILAAVALPQYNKAVWKSRATQLLTTTRSLANAQEVYKMASGDYSTAISELDIDFASLTPRSTATLGTTVPSTDAIRGDNWTEIIINLNTHFTLSTAFFIAGPYTGTGFVFPHYDEDNVLDKKIYCIERTDLNITEGIFCTKLFKATNKVATKWLVRIYEMP